MSWTYSTLTSAIQAWTENDATEFTDQIDTIIALAEERIYREADLDVFRKYATASLTNADRFLDKPSDIVVDRWMNVSVNSSKYNLLRKDTSFIAEYWPDPTSTSAPLFYADWDQATFILGPTPDSNYTVELAYTYRPTGLTSVNTTTWLGTNTPGLILAACLVEAFNFMKGEKMDLEQWEAKYQQALQSVKLEEQTRQRITENRYGEPR